MKFTCIDIGSTKSAVIAGNTEADNNTTEHPIVAANENPFSFEDGF